MEIAFATKSLRTICLSAAAMNERYGAEQATLLRRCLADLSAAECLGDVPLLQLKFKNSGLGNEATITLGGQLEVHLKINHQMPPKLSDGGPDWHKIDRILIHRIERTHA